MEYQAQLKTLRLRNLGEFRQRHLAEESEIREYRQKFAIVSSAVDSEIELALKELARNYPDAAKELYDLRDELTETANQTVINEFQGTGRKNKEKLWMNAELDEQFFLFPGL